MTNFNGFDNGVVFESAEEVASDQTATDQVFSPHSELRDEDSTVRSDAGSSDDLGEDSQVSEPLASHEVEGASDVEGGLESETDSNSSGDSFETQQGGPASEGDEFRDALLTADDSADLEDDSDDDGSQRNGMPFADPDLQPSFGTVMVKLDEIDDEQEETYSRERKDSIVIDEYTEVIAAGNGDNFPPPTLDRATIDAPKKKLIDGAHRVAAFKRYRQKREKFVEAYKRELERREDEDLKDEPTLTPPPPAPDEIPCRFVDVPKNIPVILFSYTFNRRHGLRPRAQDRKKTARSAYQANRGIPLTVIASSLGVSVKTVRHDLKDLLEEYEALKLAHILKRGVEGASVTDIAKELAEKFPYGKGISESSVSRMLDDYTEDLKNRPKKEKKETGSKKDPIDKGHGAAGKDETDGKGVYPPSSDAKPQSPSPQPATPASGGTPAAKTDGGGADAKPAPKAPKKDVSAKGKNASRESPTSPPDTIAASDGSVVQVGIDESSITQDPTPFSVFVSGMKRDIKLIPYDLWNFGFSLAEFFVNLLFFFTNPGDEIVSMGIPRSGSHHNFPDISSSMGRNYLLWEESKGWPRSAQRTNLVFVTYPALKDSSVPSYRHVHIALLKANLERAHENVQIGAKLVLLCTEQLGDDTLLLFDYADVIRSAGWQITRCIPAPTPHPSDEKYKSTVENRNLFPRGRYLLIAEKKPSDPEQVAGNDHSVVAAPAISPENTSVVDKSDPQPSVDSPKLDADVAE